MLFSLLLFFLATAYASDGTSRQLHVLNQSGEKVSVEWIHPGSGQAVPLGAPTSGEEMLFHSFVNHTFLVRSDNDCATHAASNSSTTFKVSDDKRQVIVIREGLLLESLDQTHVESAEIPRTCHHMVKASRSERPSESIVDGMAECLVSEVADLFQKKNEELLQERSLRLDVAAALENYTCADPARETSDPIEVKTWAHEDVERTVHVLHSRPSSQIHLLKHFITEDECAAVEKAAVRTLHRGTVADGKGGSRLSENRKAWQAAIPHNWHVEGDPIAAVSRRVFAYANHAAGYNMTYDGQEDLMSIQYFGNGTDDPTPDRYMPHCDGDCDGNPHKTGGRVATMVMYCDIPTLGGGTNFQNSNVFVRPAKGAAAFFSYMDAKTMKMETGFTTHSGCPVYAGTKRIAVQWMRVGVSAESPWDSFDTNTVKRSAAREMLEEE